MTLLKSFRELRPQGKPLPPKIGDTQIDTDNDNLLKQKPTSKNIPGNQYWNRKTYTVTDELLKAQCR